MRRTRSVVGVLMIVVGVAFAAQLTPTADGPVTRTDIAGDMLASRLGPTFYATEDPDDESTGWGGP